MSAAVDAVGAIPGAFLSGRPGMVPDTYNRSLRELQPLYQGAADRQPEANIAGAALSPNLLGKATVGARVGSAALGGALTSYMGGEDTDDVSGNLDRAKGGAELGGLLQATTEGVSPVLGKVAKGLRKASEINAVNAAGTRAGITDQMAKMGIDPEDYPALGRKFLDEGLIPTGLNPFRNPLEQTRQRADALRKSAGGRIGEALDKAEASGAVFDPAAAQDAMRAKMSIANPLQADNAGKANKLVDLVGDLTPQGEYASGAGFRQANKMKSEAWDGADFRADAKMVPALYRKSVSGMRDDIQRQVGAATSPDVEAGLAAANKQFSTAATAETLARKASSRDLQKKPFSLARSVISSAAGAGAGGMAGGMSGVGVGAVLGPLITDSIANRGPNIAARGYQAASGAARLAAGAINQSPQLAGKAGSMLEDYLRPMDDEERQKKAASNYTSQTGGR